MNNFKQEKPAAALTRPWVVGLAASFCCLLWGSAFPAVKIGYRLLDIGGEDSAAQIVYAGLRFFIAGVLIVLVHCLRERRFVAPKPSSWPMVAKLGLVQTAVQYFFFYIGMAHTSGVKASVITASNVFWAILISALVFRFEGLGWNKLLGCLCGFLGVVVINLSGGSLAGGLSLAGEGAIFLAAVANGLAVSMFKSYSAHEDAFVLCGYQFVLGGLLLLAGGLAGGGALSGFDPPSLLILAYMGVLSAVAYTIWSILTKYNPVASVTIYGFLNPVFGVLLSALLLGEQNQAFTVYGLAALALVCLGIFLVNRAKG